MSTSISKSRLIASKSRKSGGIRRVWAVKQAGGPTEYPISWRYLVTAHSRWHVAPAIRQEIGGIWPRGLLLRGSIRRPEPPSQINVRRSCVFLRKYCHNLTVSLVGYPGGISLSHSSHLSVPHHAAGSIPGLVTGPIPGPTRGPIPGPGVIPTASAAVPAGPHP